MIGRLPTSLEINGVCHKIRSDYRVVLTVFQAYNEPDYTDDEKSQIAIECIYEHPEELKQEDIAEAINQATWFMNGGENDVDTKRIQSKKIMDWEQDEQLIFSAVNKVAGIETRSVDYMHWWTFLGYFKERGECLLNTVINLRDKMINKREKLTKDEKEFYRSNRAMIDLKKRLTAKEKEENEYYERLLTGKE